MTITIFPKIKISITLLIMLIIGGFSGFLFEMILMILSIIGHELGHGVMILLFKGKIEEIKIGFFGGNLKVNLPNDLSIFKKNLINLGGSSY